jgi:hypothetical protein
MDENYLSELNILTDIVNRIGKTSLETSRFTNVTADEIERLGPAMRNPATQREIFARITAFVNTQVAQRQELNADLERTSQKMMRDIETENSESLPQFPEDGPGLRGWVDGLEAFQTIVEQTLWRFDSLSKTYASSKGYEAGMVKAYESASEQCKIIVSNLLRVHKYVGQLSMIVRRRLDAAA